MEWITDPEAWIALATLTALEIVLGIDNIIFLSIVVGRLAPHQRQLGRILGLAGAMFTRILLLLSLAWIMRLNTPVFTLFAQEISGRDIILILGGLFLLGKSTHAIHGSLEGEEETSKTVIRDGFVAVLIQIAYRIRLNQLLCNFEPPVTDDRAPYAQLVIGNFRLTTDNVPVTTLAPIVQGKSPGTMNHQIPLCTYL
jgi:Integral membrane protein TerC family